MTLFFARALAIPASISDELCAPTDDVWIFGDFFDRGHAITMLSPYTDADDIALAHSDDVVSQVAQVSPLDEGQMYLCGDDSVYGMLGHEHEGLFQIVGTYLRGRYRPCVSREKVALRELTCRVQAGDKIVMKTR